MAGVEPRIGITKYGNEAIIHPSANHPDKSYLFSIKRRGKHVSTWKCIACHCMKDKDKNLPSVPFIKVQTGILDTDPSNPSNPHFCTPEDTHTIEAYQIHREKIQEIRKSSKRPHDAYREAIAVVRFWDFFVF